MSVRVTELPVTVNRFTENPVGCPKRRRTAAYARVSSNHDDQLTSYAAQVSYPLFRIIGIFDVTIRHI